MACSLKRLLAPSALEIQLCTGPLQISVQLFPIACKWKFNFLSFFSRFLPFQKNIFKQRLKKIELTKPYTQNRLDMGKVSVKAL